jgi:transposase
MPTPPPTSPPTSTILPDPHQLDVVSLRAERQSITAVARTRARETRCPQCGCASRRIQSRYVRRPADLPWHGVVMRLELHVRRFFCDTPDCPQAIFAERLPGVLAPYARRTDRLAAWCTAVGFALGGEAGARLLASLGLTTSPATLLACIRARALPAASTPRVLGVDDWSFRKGRTFGTILVDLEQRRVIDLLPDREALTFATWLQRHPGVEIISRDRGGAYAEGARLGAPGALQVADRWHLLHNLWEVLDGFFVHRKQVLRAHQASPRRHIIEETPWLTGRTQQGEERSVRSHARFVELHQQIHDLSAKRVDIRQIAQRLQISRGTVYRYLRMQQPPTRAQCPVPHPLPLDSYKPYLLRRWNEGCRNAQQLWRELGAHGYTQSRSTGARFIGLLRIETGQRKKYKSVSEAQLYEEQGTQEDTVRPLTTRQAARLLLTVESQRTAAEQATLSRLLAADPEIATAYRHVQAFGCIVRERRGSAFDSWVAQALHEACREIQNFVHGLLKDEAAVRAGLTLPWSQGQVEGQVNKLKLLKRASYGRARLDLLRQRTVNRLVG